MALILLVEDENLLRWTLTERLRKSGHEVLGAGTLGEARACLDAHKPDVMLLDLGLPDGHGLDFFEQNRDRLEDTVVLINTAVGEVDDAVRAMKLGAFDFLTKPIDHGELVALVDRSLKYRGDQLEAEAARRSRENESSMKVIAVDPAFRRTLSIAEEVARSSMETILIFGESGTGKNVIGRYIHARSDRAGKPLLEVNCAAIPETLLESELFGHEKGAFTDAKSSKKGIFELAAGGTVLLDEIGELRLGLQSKLLHFLEERRFRRVGGTREILADVRVISLTNRDIEAMVEDKEFRDDLFYRLSVFPVEVPALRQRVEDILPLTEYFLKSLGGKFGRKYRGLTREAENLFLTYEWPGNVRELRNAIERAMILERGERITPESVLLHRLGRKTRSEEPDGGIPKGIVPLEVVEREMVRRAMVAAAKNQTRAAELLEITRDQLRYRLKKYEEEGRPLGLE